MADLAKLQKQLQALDDDFTVWSGPGASAAAIARAEKALRVKLSPEHRALVMALGGVAVVADEKVWPRARELEIRPTWQFQHGLEIFGVAKAKPLDAAAQAKACAADAEQPLVPLARRVGSRLYVGYGKDGKLVEWEPGGRPARLEARSALGLLSAMLRELAADKERMKAETASKAKAKPKGPAGDPLLGRLLSDDFDERRKAGEELARVKGARRAALATALLAEATRAKPRDRAVGALGDLTDDPRVVTALKKLAKHRNADVRGDALDALRFAEKRPDGLLAIFVAALADADADVRRSAVEGLGDLADGKAKKPLLGALARARRDKRWTFGVEVGNVLEALGKCAPGDPDVVATLVDHLVIEEHHNAANPAFAALIGMGAKARAARPALEALVTGKNRWREIHARHALIAIGDPPAAHLPAMIEALADGSEYGAIQASAKLALRDLGPVARAAVAAAARQGKTAKLRKAAAQALAFIGQSA